MKIVMDTNVLVSGLLSPFNPPGGILRLILTDFIQVFYDARIISKYSSVLARSKFNFHQKSTSVILRHIETQGQPVAAPPVNYQLPDEGDRPFLEVALAAGIPYIVTGNIRHFPKKQYKQTHIVSPAGFREEYRGSHS
jgi:putative PIN family toxin of toxin-antitoxin system